jgi:hypothetical protein
VSVLFNASSKYLTYASKHPAWSSGTTYSIGNSVVSNDGTNDRTYKVSVAGGGTSTVAPTEANVGTGLADGYTWLRQPAGPASGLFGHDFYTDGCTISVWVAHSGAADSTQEYLFWMGDDGADTNFTIWGRRSATSGVFTGVKRNTGNCGSDHQTATAAYSTDGWVHYACTFSPNGDTGGTPYVTVYRNGVADSPASTDGERSINVAPNQIALAQVGSFAVNTNFEGHMAHFAMWDAELSGSDISALYNGGSGGNGVNPTTIQSANLRAYWSLTEGDISSSLVSQEGNAWTLTNNGSVTYANPGTEAPVDGISTGGNQKRFLMLGIG